MDRTRYPDEDERHPKRYKPDPSTYSTPRQPRDISPRSISVGYSSASERIYPQREYMPAQRRSSHGYLAEEKELRGRDWRSGMDKASSITRNEPLNLELDPNYQNWTPEEKEADRQRWRRENGRIPGIPRIKPLKLGLDPNYENWTPEEKEVYRQNWRLENGRISTSAVRVAGGTAEDSKLDMNVLAMRPKHKPQEQNKEVVRDLKEEMKEEKIKKEEGSSMQEGRRKGVVELCDKWVKSVEKAHPYLRKAAITASKEHNDEQHNCGSRKTGTGQET